MAENSPNGRTVVRRATYVGSQATPDYVVRSVALKPLSRVDTVRVETISEYEAGCSVHKECFGHMCKAPGGTILVPQSLASSKGETSKDYLKAAKYAFSGDAVGYADAVRNLNLTKSGKMRKDILGSAIAGSARLVIVPQVQFPGGTVAFPRNIASLMRIPVRVEDKDTGMPTNVIVSLDYCSATPNMKLFPDYERTPQYPAGY
ncbi:hypothetical protein TSTA_110460 [Talaromyces stipitatus ATCC 10500]|uniref:Uncharacterized protein n=1 Tax=Talaromyces stipitatus (strain ATCC 10500 / CBS 375.48 / QM 6759 / NRRL 1006) TaxID=441959 RepID=B8MUU6_TALSN|nr:uncharacterized protein TSTA_110460 [Talaromyces stipitatus ATCC 10500]EED11866.1 hypothetical protein TSTA_110460 [Talaromyces stipitatus ATCC 10500]